MILTLYSTTNCWQIRRLGSEKLNRVGLQHLTFDKWTYAKFFGVYLSIHKIELQKNYDTIKRILAQLTVKNGFGLD